MITPVKIRCQYGCTFNKLAPLLIVERTVAPSTGPKTPPTAPNKLVPPITEEATACNSHVKPFEAMPKLNLAATSMPTIEAKSEEYI